jgi:hypothetical protein
MCHVSVGHVARAVEESGIPTVGVYVSAFRFVAEEMKLPRTLITHHPFGRPIGPVGQPDRHLEVVMAALSLFETTDRGGTLVEMPGRFAAG